MGRKGSIYPEYEESGDEDNGLEFDDLGFDEELDFSDDYEAFDDYEEEENDDEYCDAG